MLVRDQYDDGGLSGGTLERPGLQRLHGGHRGRAGRRGGGLQDRPPQPLAGRLRQAGRGVRPPRGHLRLGDAVVQHDHVDGPADAEHPALVRPVRARGHRRAHPRQGRRQPQEGHVDGRGAALRLPRREPEAGGRRRKPPSMSAGSSPASSRSARARNWRGRSRSAASARRAATGSTRSTSTGC